MDIVLIALKNLGAWTVPISIAIIFVCRLLVWHQRFVAFTEDFEGTLRKVNMATYCNDWKEVVTLLNGRYESYMSKMQIFDEEAFMQEYQDGISEATRVTSEKLINAIAAQNPTFLSGTADLASSTKTIIKNAERFSCENYGGRNLFFGIREFAMVAIMNGMALHKGIKVAAGGFMVFSDYFKAALRMSSLMKLPIILPLSHDSIAVGEDGPTHQPVEQLAMLRSIPNIQVIRSADAYEMCAAWKKAIETNDRPTALILTRQNVTNFTHATYDDVCHGAYIVSKEKGQLDGILIATGSELELAMKAQEALYQQGHDVRVVSMPSMELFDAQDEAYKEMILPSNIRKRVVIEMASPTFIFLSVGYMFAFSNLSPVAIIDTTLWSWP